MNGQIMPQLVNTCISSIFRYAAAAQRSRKDCPRVSLLSILAEVNDDDWDIELWLPLNPAHMYSSGLTESVIC